MEDDDEEGKWEGEEEEEEDSLHTVYLQLYPELIAYPCLLLLQYDSSNFLCFNVQMLDSLLHDIT